MPAAETGTASDFVSRPTHVRGFDAAFAAEEAHVSRARRLTGAHLRQWHVSDQLAEDIVLAVSELVTNAVSYGCGQVSLKVWCTTDELIVEVADGNPAMLAELRCPAEDDVSGRGLFLVAALATRWGVSDGGATTWCLFTTGSR
ncbi:ATP-binding protein [Streptomyces montanisoli]|uniref:ATP-binding protein n=1 Tax=Streptomyces montanisoli TaxID=2798581 RepID=UPI0027DD49B8|nr:ATP-binding protein [Streptomyces montanisoli]